MELLEIGRIIRPHGLTGRVKVLSYIESQEVLVGLSEVLIGREVHEAVPYELIAAQTGRNAFIMQLGGIELKEAADGLVGLSVWIPSGKMKKLSDDEYYWREIIGLEVRTEEGRSIGRIDSVFPTGSNDVYVCRDGEKEILLPGISEVVRKVDIDAGVMVVRLLKGLADS
jgi:16S rRNA processing protein RimM